MSLIGALVLAATAGASAVDADAVSALVDETHTHEWMTIMSVDLPDDREGQVRIDLAHKDSVIVRGEPHPLVLLRFLTIRTASIEVKDALFVVDCKRSATAEYQLAKPGQKPVPPPKAIPLLDFREAKVQERKTGKTMFAYACDQG